MQEAEGSLAFSLARYFSLSLCLSRPDAGQMSSGNIPRWSRNESTYRIKARLSSLNAREGEKSIARLYSFTIRNETTSIIAGNGWQVVPRASPVFQRKGLKRIDRSSLRRTTAAQVSRSDATFACLFVRF